MDISTLNDFDHVFLDDMEIVRIPASASVGRARLKIVDATDATLLDSWFYREAGDIGEYIDVDMKRFSLEQAFRKAASWPVPTHTSDWESALPALFLRLTVTIGETTVNKMFYLDPVHHGAASRFTDIKMLRVPEDYRLPVCLFCTTAAQNVRLYSWLCTPAGDEVIDEQLISDTYSRPIFLREFPLSGSDGPFRLDFAFKANGDYSPEFEKRSTPTFIVAPGEFRQYAFLNKYGHYDNIPMAGVFRDISEYDFENANLYSGLVPVSGICRRRFSQNAGHLDRSTMAVLQQLLTSPYIYYLAEDNVWKRIVIESVSLSREFHRSPASGLTFEWRYVTD